MRWVVLLVMAASTVASADDGDVTALGWPAQTTRARVRHRARIFSEPGGRGRLGTLAHDAELDVLEVAKVHHHYWVELAPRGWVDASDLEPATGDPADDGPHLRFGVTKDLGADSYEHVGEIEASEPTHRRAHTYLSVKDGRTSFKVNGTPYIKTDLGFMAVRDIEWLEPSTFEGIKLAPGASLDMAWAVARKAGKPIDVHDVPARDAVVTRQLERRELVKVIEERDGFARLDGGGWVDAVELRQPRTVARPDGVGEHDPWIDVDLDEQVLLAYEGDTPVFVTVVSSGVAHSTPTGIYRIRGKDRKTRMQSPPEVAAEWGWNVAEVPFSMRFRKNYALHGAYWHDGFGRERSQGCINLSPKDAQFLFDWVTPEAPAGWSSVEAPAGSGTAVRIHSHRDPHPSWMPFDPDHPRR
jgi:hypothetical protein